MTYVSYKAFGRAVTASPDTNVRTDDRGRHFS